MKSSRGNADAPLILVVDDNVLERMIVREPLEQGGFTVAEAEDGERGIRAFHDLAPCLVLLDVKMPGRDGFDVCTTIRADPDGAHVPIIMMTGLDDVDSINRAYEVGATDFLTKSTQTAILIHRVRYVLRAKRTADELRESQARLARAQRMAKLGHWEWEKETNEVTWSQEVGEIFGASPVSSTDFRRELGRFVHADDRLSVENAFQQAMETSGTASVEHRIVRPDGSERVVHQDIDVSWSADGVASRVVGTMQDITERHEAEQRIRRLAYYDNITGLANRTLLKDHIRFSLSRAERHTRILALLFLDLDHFKRVNDTFGHNMGDDLLRQVADRLASCIRECDYLARRDGSPNGESLPIRDHTVARLGGDEFVILLPEIKAPEDAALVARRINAAFALPFILHDKEIYLTASIGISSYPMDGRDADSLLKHADAAMYHAKAQGRNRYQFYTTSINARALERLSLETSLRKALERDEFVLHYQPRLDIRSGRVISVEALVRWMNPELGLVPPGQFIPVAEETGLIVPLGEWVLREACRQAGRWKRTGTGPCCVSVNVSAAQLKQRDFKESIAAAIERGGIGPYELELELTESMLMDDVSASATLLKELKEIGVHVSIDDFGTGYSSLSYLKKLPIESLKIDQSFIRDITVDADDATIVTATIGLGQSLRLRVVAEGVEYEEQLEFLRTHGCDEAQGYLFGRPQAAAELDAWLRASPYWKTPAAVE